MKQMMRRLWGFSSVYGRTFGAVKNGPFAPPTIGTRGEEEKESRSDE